MYRACATYRRPRQLRGQQETPGGRGKEQHQVIDDSRAGVLIHSPIPDPSAHQAVHHELHARRKLLEPGLHIARQDAHGTGPEAHVAPDAVGDLQPLLRHALAQLLHARARADLLLLRAAPAGGGVSCAARAARDLLAAGAVGGAGCQGAALCSGAASFGRCCSSCLQKRVRLSLNVIRSSTGAAQARPLSVDAV